MNRFQASNNTSQEKATSVNTRIFNSEDSTSPKNGSALHGAIEIETVDGLIHVDASKTRRENRKLRSQSAAASKDAVAPRRDLEIPSESIAIPESSSSLPPAVQPSPMTDDWWNRVMRDVPVDAEEIQGPTTNLGADTVLETGTEPDPSSQATSTDCASSKSGVKREELQQFLVNFIVEQTGYPEDIVELDADLEGDLGIDSIKKAQMFGEIGEYFGLVPDESMSLDDFPTLNHVLNYLQRTLSTESEEATSPVVPINAATRSPATSTSDSSGELRAFLVNFVVEQTGYPEEIVEMDADLEGDLGIDSIKKAQMFGEIGEFYGLEPDENLSLDDFPTLNHVLNYLISKGIR